MTYVQEIRALKKQVRHLMRENDRLRAQLAAAPKPRKPKVKPVVDYEMCVGGIKYTFNDN